MGLLQAPPSGPGDLVRQAGCPLPPDVVDGMDAGEWAARAFQGDAPQLTARSLATGLALGFVLAFANVYLSLKTGLALGVALTACLASTTLWSALARAGLARAPLGLLETNCMQSTASSAGYTTSVIAATALPALLLLSATDAAPAGRNVPWPVAAAWIGASGALGVFLAVPMKRLLLDRERLRFPSGTAAAVLLRGLHARGSDALARGRALLAATGLAALAPLLKDLHVRVTRDATGAASRAALWPGPSRPFDALGGLQVRALDPATHTLVDRVVRASELGIALDHGVALVGAGAIVGLRVALGMTLGGLVVALGLAPLGLGWTWTNASGAIVAAVKAPGSAWKDVGTWFGAPVLVAYGLTGFALATPGLVRGLRAMAAGDAAGTALPPGADVPLTWFAAGSLSAGAAVVAVGRLGFAIPVGYGALAVVLCAGLTLVACRVTGEADLTPVGPLGKVVQLTYGALLPQSPAANLVTTGMTAGAGLAAADLLNDLKTGRLLGAHPRRQFVAQLAGVAAGTVATCLAYYALVPDAAALTGAGGHVAAFPAPAAQQWKTVAQLFLLGPGNLHPLARAGLVLGTGIGATLALLERLAPRCRRFTPSPTGIGLGLILPCSISLGFLLGAALAAGASRVQSGRFEPLVVPVASGLIAGESVMGVLVAFANLVAFRP